MSDIFNRYYAEIEKIYEAQRKTGKLDLQAIADHMSDEGWDKEILRFVSKDDLEPDTMEGVIDMLPKLTVLQVLGNFMKHLADGEIGNIKKGLKDAGYEI